MAQTDDKLTDLTIAAAAQLRAAPLVELTDAYLERIERLNPAINAYVTVTGERARADARRAADEIAKSGPRGPLHGVPIALKDLCDTAGIRTTAGGKFFADHVPKADCAVARRLREAGSVLLGKLNTHEFAYGVTTDNPHFGATRNPWDQSRIPGGSSGGSGAAIAARCCRHHRHRHGRQHPDPRLALRRRRPQADYGRVSKAGIFPLSFISTMPARSPVRSKTPQSCSKRSPIRPCRPDERASAGRPPYLAPRGAPGTARMCCGAIYERLDRGRRRAGVGARRPRFDRRQRAGCSAEPETAIRSFRCWPGQAHPRRAVERAAADFGADVAEILPGNTTGAELVAAMEATYALTRAMRETLETVDVLVTPTTPIPAVKIGQRSVRTDVESPIFAMIRCTAVQRDSPSGAFGALWPRDGLPIAHSQEDRSTSRPFASAMLTEGRMAPAKAGAVK
jgi:aspartyl-tRNA(Asn)/glutamyl-tRNA(Gln) amidotransferase subunit A